MNKSSKSQAAAAASFAARGEGAIAVPWLPIALFGRLRSSVGSLFSRVFGSFVWAKPARLGQYRTGPMFNSTAVLAQRGRRIGGSYN